MDPVRAGHPESVSIRVHSCLQANPMSISQKTAFYVTGGTLRPDAECYVERQADVRIHESLTRGDFCYVLTSRQMGKSSLMVRTVQALRKDGQAVAVLDLTAIGQNLTVEQWYVGMLERLGRQLDLEDELEDYWDDHKQLGPVQRWFAALHEIALKTDEAKQGLVIFVDEIDAVRSLPFSTDEFFAAIRECYNRRSAEPEFARLSFCLLGVATPSDLIRDTRTTPFNIGQRIELQDFSETEAESLLGGLEGVFGKDLAARILKRVLYWTNGQPYLTQLFCRRLAEHPEVRTIRNVDHLCSELFLSEQAREKNDNLVFVRERLLRSEVDQFELLQLYDRILRGRRVVDDPSNPLIPVLRLSGATRDEDGLLKVRSPIYRRVFNHQWVTANLPGGELRRQREAYRRGLLRAALMASVVLILICSLWIDARYQAFRADESAGNESIARKRAEKATVEAKKAALQVSEVLHQMEMRRSEDMFNNDRAPEGVAYLAGLLRLDPSNRTAARRIVSALNRRNFARPVSDPKEERQIIESPRVPTGQAKYDWQMDRTNRFEVRIVRLSDSEVVRVIKHEGQVLYAHISPDNSRVVTASMDNTARIWNIHTGTLTVPVLQHETPVGRVRFSHDGLRVVTTGFGRTMRVWDAMSGRALTERIRGSGDAEFSGNGLGIISRSRRRGGPGGSRFGGGSKSRVWDIQNSAEWMPPLRHQAKINSVNYSPDGRQVVLGSADGRVRIWNVADGLPVGEALPHKGEVVAAEFSADGLHLLTAEAEGLVRLWKLPLSGEIALTVNCDRWLTAVQFSPAGKRVLLANSRGRFQVWSLPEAKPMFEKDLQRKIEWAEFDATGDRLLTVSDAVRIWNAHTGELISDGIGHFERITAAHFDPTGKTVVTYSAEQSQLWNLETGEPLEVPLEHSAFIRTAAFNRAGDRLVTGSQDRTVRLWDVATGEQVGDQLLHNGAVAFTAILNDGQRLLTSTSVHESRIWDLQSGQPLSEYFRFPHTHAYQFSMNRSATTALSPDGNSAAVLTDANTVRIWNFGDVPVPVPDWLPALAEHISGERIDERGVVTAVDRGALRGLRRQIAEADTNDWYTAWGQWHLADRGERPIAPGSIVTRQQLVERLLNEGSHTSLHEAALLAPADSRVFAAMADEMLHHGGELAPLEQDLADFFSQRAAHLATDPVVAWTRRAELLEKLQRWQKALDAMDVAEEAAPSDASVKESFTERRKVIRARLTDLPVVEAE